jgi:hypothetical protein
MSGVSAVTLIVLALTRLIEYNHIHYMMLCNKCCGVLSRHGRKGQLAHERIL